MNLDLVSSFYAVVAVAALWLALLYVSRQQPNRCTRTSKALFGIVTVLLLFVPIGGLPLWNRAFSFYPNPSLPMLGIVCAALWLRLLGIAVFKPADWRTIWLFGAIVGSMLYLHPMLFGAVDLYYWGWERESATWTLAALAAAMFARGSRLGVLLLAALIAYGVNALESQNCWDYVMDPIYWLIGLTITGSRVCTRVLAPARAWWRARERERKPAFAPAVALEPVTEEVTTGER